MVRVICKAAKGDGRAVGRGLREAGRPGPAPSLTRGHNILPTAPGTASGSRRLSRQRLTGELTRGTGCSQSGAGGLGGRDAWAEPGRLMDFLKMFYFPDY